MALATNANLRLRFTAQPGNLGTNTMNIIRNFTTQVLRVDFPGAYIGQPFEFRDTDGTIHTNTFINGTRNI